MRSLPRISLTAHGLLELIVGLSLLVTALIVDLGGGGTVLVFVTGVALAGIGLGAADTLPLSVHHALDHTLVIALALAAVALATAGGGGLAAVILLATAAVVLVLESATRWTRSTLR